MPACKVFPTGGWGKSPASSRKFAHPPTWKSPHNRLPLPDLYLRLPMINSLTKQQLTCYSLIKTLFLAAIIVQLYHFYLNFILFVHTGHVNFDFNRCSVFTECCF